MNEPKADAKAIFLQGARLQWRRRAGSISQPVVSRRRRLAGRVEVLLRAHRDAGVSSAGPWCWTIRGTNHRPKPPARRSARTSSWSRSARAASASSSWPSSTQPVRRKRRPEGAQAGHGHPAGDRPVRGRAAGPGPDGPPEHRQGARRRAAPRPAARTSSWSWSAACRSPSSATRTTCPSAQRLELFVAVCQAVQHAHQKGVIHRDLKPSNVLVTLHDGVPVAKVIDFGIAKAMGQQLTERTLFTNFAQMVGTPLYMSPGAGGDERPGRGHPHRHLRPGRAPVRAADRDHAAGQGAVQDGRVRRDPADHPGGGAGPAEHAGQHARGGGRHDLGEPPDRPVPGCAGCSAASWTGS